MSSIASTSNAGLDFLPPAIERLIFSKLSFLIISFFLVSCEVREFANGGSARCISNSLISTIYVAFRLLYGKWVIESCKTNMT
jgi:hypothetical protein